MPRKTSGFAWSKLPNPIPTPDARLTRIDVESETPEPVRVRLQSAFEIWSNSDGASPGWLEQHFPSPAMAEEFVRLARRYCANRKDAHGLVTPDSRWTFRGGQLPDSPDVVRFSVRSFEQRSRRNAA